MKKKIESLFNDLYLWEIDQKDRFNNQLSFPATILTIMFGVLFIIAQGLPTQMNSTIGIVFLFSLAATTLTVIIFVILLIRSTLGYDYEYLPDSESIREYFFNLESFYYNNMGEDISNEEISSLVENDISDYLIEYCSSAATRNRENNIKKGKHLHNAKAIMALSFVLMLFTVFFYGIIKSKETKITKVQIVNIEKGGGGMEIKNESLSSMNDSIDSQDLVSVQNENNIKKSVTYPNDTKKPEPPKNVRYKYAEEGNDNKNVRKYNK